MPNVGGQWEFIAASTTSPGYTTGVEVALQQGTVFSVSNGGYNPTGQISASGTQIGFMGLDYLNGSSKESIAFGGNCTPATPEAGNSLTGSISGVGGSMNFTFTENGSVYNVTAILDASGKSIDSGTYTLQSGSGCGGDTGGTLTGEIVPKISGTFIGQIVSPCPPPQPPPYQNPPCDSNGAYGGIDSATATLSQSGSTLTINLLLTGADNTSLTLTGPVAGNSFSAQGTFEGIAISYEGYFQYVFDSLDGLYDTPNLYLENVACISSNPQTCASLLTIPIVP